MAKTRFKTGQVAVADPEVLRALGKAHIHPFILIKRHMEGDWGDLDADDKRQNDLAVLQGGAIRSAYILPDGRKVLVSTNGDRSTTTLSLAAAY